MTGTKRNGRVLHAQINAEDLAGVGAKYKEYVEHFRNPTTKDMDIFVNFTKII